LIEKMTELLATVAITLSSVALFAYWFRYTTLLMLSARTARDYALAVATANGLNFLGVQAQLRETGASDLDRLYELLDRDYAIIARMLTQLSGSTVESGLETRMLAIDYRLAGAWYRVSRRFSVESARQALEEMSLVVAHFANSVGEASAAA
jgi:hypothetical protein